jgi:hypothetical protein
MSRTQCTGARAGPGQLIYKNFYLHSGTTLMLWSAVESGGIETGCDIELDCNEMLAILHQAT